MVSDELIVRVKFPPWKLLQTDVHYTTIDCKTASVDHDILHRDSRLSPPARAAPRFAIGSSCFLKSKLIQQDKGKVTWRRRL